MTGELNEEETENLRSAIEGQNSDGFGESFKQRAIRKSQGLQLGGCKILKTTI